MCRTLLKITPSTHANHHFRSTRSGMLERESMGLNTEDADAVFPQQVVVPFMTRTIQPHPESRCLLCCMDPSGGGDSSMSLVTLSLLQNRISIIAIDEQQIKGVAQMESMLLSHVAAVRTYYPQHWMIFAFESNLGQEAAHASSFLERHNVAKRYVIQEKDRIGVLTTNSRKELYADNLRFFLEQQAIGFREPLLNGKGSEAESVRLKQLLREQLSNYRRCTVEAAPGRIAKWHYTGKSKWHHVCLSPCKTHTHSFSNFSCW